MKVLFFALILLCGFLFAGDKKGNKTVEANVSVSTRTVSQPQRNQNGNKVKISAVSVEMSTDAEKVNFSSLPAQPGKKEVKKDDDEYSTVMTDVMETQTYQFYPTQDEQQDREISNPIPVTYGKIKATMNEMGRNYLVLENEDGEIYILNVYTNKNGLFLWKLYAKFERN